MEPLGDEANSYRGIVLAQRLEPDVTLMDIRIHQLDGLAALEQLPTQGSAARVRVVTTFSEEEHIDSAPTGGAS